MSGEDSRVPGSLQHVKTRGRAQAGLPGAVLSRALASSFANVTSLQQEQPLKLQQELGRARKPGEGAARLQVLSHGRAVPASEWKVGPSENSVLMGRPGRGEAVLTEGSLPEP